MKSTDLHPEQLRRLRQTATRHLRWHVQLCERMTRLGFPGDDPLYRAAVAAKDRQQDPVTAVLYAGCKEGVGRPPADPPGAV